MDYGFIWPGILAIYMLAQVYIKLARLYISSVNQGIHVQYSTGMDHGSLLQSTLHRTGQASIFHFHM
jgi:hypothetical protein